MIDNCLKKIKNKTLTARLNAAVNKSLLILILLLSPLPLFAAQLIDTIPTELLHNWKVCAHFDTRPAECQDSQLPQKRTILAADIKYQSYSKDFIISSDLKPQALGLWLKVVDDVDRVFINGELIGKTGEFPPSLETGFRQQRLYFITNEQLKYNRFNQIEIQTFSSVSLPGLQMQAPVIGDFLLIQKQQKATSYVYIITASLLAMLAVFPIFYLIVVKENNESLFLMIFLIAFACFALTRSTIAYDLELDLNSIYKLENFLLNTAVISVILFLFRFFELELRRFYIFGLFVIGLATLTLIIWPYNIQLRLLAEINYWLVCLTIPLVGGSSLLIAIHKQRRYAWSVSVGCVSGWLLLCYDATIWSSNITAFELPPNAAIVPIGATILGILLTLTLNHKYWNYFKGSTYDQLTGTLLRPAFFQRLSEEIQRSKRSDTLLLVAVIDIQQAKKIRLNYSYSIGNHLLTRVSNSLTKVLRPYDLICRFSDDQFCIAAGIDNRQDAEANLKRIYQALVNIQQLVDDQIELYVDARIGGVLYNKELHLSVSHLVQDANYALSKAKSQSKQSYLLEQSSLLQYS